MRTDNPTCDFDCWTIADVTPHWLMMEKATRLKTEWGFHFYEDPRHGDEGPVLAIDAASGLRSPVWNTQDFDLPTCDPRAHW